MYYFLGEDMALISDAEILLSKLMLSYRQTVHLM